MDKISVLLADDHVLMREGTRQLLECNNDFEVVAEADDGLQAVELAAEWQPDVILMDIAMPKLNGIEATKQIKATCPATAVLILTAYDDDQYVFALLEAGAAGYLSKKAGTADLLEAVRSVFHGGSYF